MTTLRADAVLRPNGACPSLRRVVSTCIARDMEVWNAAQCRIVERIEASEYLLICPAKDVDQFRRRSAGAWRICADEDFCSAYDLQQIHSNAKGAARARRGWLLQQFLKINACIDPVLEDDETVLIWDADTIPLRRLRFTDDEGRILYYRSPEYHPPYFETLRKLFGHEGFSSRSFIAQCFPTRVRWARNMTEALRDPESGSYIETVVHALDGAHASEFAEYETMGTWNLMHHADKMGHATGRWSRGGAKWIGHRPSGAFAAMMLGLLSLRYDYIAVESWQQSNLQSVLSGLVEAGRSLLSTGT